jgi:hypothetical protein
VHRPIRSPKGKRGEELHGQYANYFKVGHNAAEFVIDLGQFYSGNGAARLHTRIVTGPTYAKALLELLRESIGEYESSHGEIGEARHDR